MRFRAAAVGPYVLGALLAIQRPHMLSASTAC